MLEPLQLTQSPARAAAVIPLRIPLQDLPSVMGPAITELLAALAAQGVAPAGPLFNRVLATDAGVFDMEVGVVVSAPVAPAGRVRPGGLPAARVVRTTYHGPYEGLHAAWGEFKTLVEAQGYPSAPGPWESYVVGPESSPDPAGYRTELNQPLVD
jgi:effector-binding domain-containing protein